MAEGVYKGITIVGTSTESFSKAIEVAIGRVGHTLRELRWFEVHDQRGALRDGIIEYQVTLEVFFRLENEQNDERRNKNKGKKKR
jgi:flavin-binding protein dodecin